MKHYKQLPTLILAFVCLATRIHSLFCSPSCMYPYATGTNSYVAGCTADNNPNACNKCDQRFYYLSSTTCRLIEDGIYNDTIVINQAAWGSSPYVGVLVRSGLNLFQFYDTGQGNLSAIQNITTAHYGVRVRLLFYVQGSPFSPSMYFRINFTIAQLVYIQPWINVHYNLGQWIFTSEHYSYRDETITIQVQRTDGNLNPVGGRVSFRDAIILMAYCVQDCLSCTSLKDCSMCAATHYLDPVTHYCTTACLDGQYSVVGNNTCQLCDAKCQKCDVAATNCTLCTESGPHQAFLLLTTCYYLPCPSSYIQNYTTHKCECPNVGYFVDLGNAGMCTACDPKCKICNGANPTDCTACNIGYFLKDASTQCVSSCPAGQYANLIYDLSICNLCDASLCVNCVNESSMCTSCTFASADRWLYNYTCVYLCPHGYQANNVTYICDECPLGMYSYENTCFSECPAYYTANDVTRACTLSGGYPLNMTISVQNYQTLKFTIPLPLGLKNSILTLLNSTWQTYISLSFVTQTQNSVLVKNRRLLSTLTAMTISNAIIASSSITLSSNSIPASDFIYTHKFVVKFADNLLSPNDVIYSIRSQVSTDGYPWVVSEFFNMNIRPFNIIGIFLTLAGIVAILMRIKYIYRILIQYVHCIQLLGLTYFVIYPYSVDLNLYAFLMGLDYSNFSFMYNIPGRYISPCYHCQSLVSFAFAIGDMNWLRMMGSLLLSLAIMFVFWVVIYCFTYTREYALFFINLIVDLILIKTIHGWFSSLVYSGLNMKYNRDDLDVYVLSMHTLSYLFLIPVLYTRFKAQLTNKYPNLSFIFLLIFIILLALLSLAPTLICALLMLTTFTEWGLSFGLKITQQQKPMTNIEQKNKLMLHQAKSSLPITFHNHLLRCIRPITAFLVACIIMIDNSTIPIALVSTVLFVIFILIILDAIFLFSYHEKVHQSDTNKHNKKPQILANNQTKQDLRLEKETEGKNYLSDMVKMDEENADDDDIVGTRFKRNKKVENQNNVKVMIKAQDLFKNVE